MHAREIQDKGASASGGFTIIEILIVLTIFSVVMAGLFEAYSVQMKAGMREYKTAESEMEFQIGKMVLDRDLATAGYGIADSYSAITGSTISSVSVVATDGNPDTLTLRGTALGREARASQAWSYVTTGTPTAEANYYAGPDSRENLRTNDRIVYMEPATKSLLALSGTAVNGTTGKSWLFTYPPSGTNPIPVPLNQGVLVYGLASSGSASTPYYTVQYTVGGTPMSFCAPSSTPGVRIGNLQRSEDGTANPLFSCVLDFQVAFGLDNVNEDGLIDCWDDGGVEAAAYTAETLRKRLKQLKAYVLVQQGNVDRDFTSDDTIVVGDSTLTTCDGGFVGRTVTFTAEQKNYRWKVIALSVTPRNIR